MYSYGSMSWWFMCCWQAQNDVVLRRAIAGCGEFKGAPKASGTEHYTNWVPKADQVCVWLDAFVRDHVSNRRCVQGFKGKGKGGKDKGGKDKRKGGASFASPEEREAKMAKVECYKCHKLGHYSTSCPS